MTELEAKNEMIIIMRDALERIANLYSQPAKMALEADRALDKVQNIIHTGSEPVEK